MTTWILAPNMHRAHAAGYTNGRDGVHVITPRNANTAARGAHIAHITAVDLYPSEVARLLGHPAVNPALGRPLRIDEVGDANERGDQP